MKRKTRQTLEKIAIVLAGSGLIATIAVLTSDVVQTRFMVRQAENTILFIDKYVGKDDAARFATGIDAATRGFMHGVGLPGRSDAVLEPVAWFLADRHYGVLGAGDPVLRRLLADRPSSDFAVFRGIASNLYANELVVRSITSQDGAYAFVTMDDDWRYSAIHAYAHSLGARNAPAWVTRALGLDQHADPDVRAQFRFVDEVFALLSTDLMRTADNASIVIDGAGQEPAAIPEVWNLLTELGAEASIAFLPGVRALESEILHATYSQPGKTADWYEACASFGYWLCSNGPGNPAETGPAAGGTYGNPTGLAAAMMRFFTGTYVSFDDLFGAWGGLDSALEAWNMTGEIPQ